MLVKMMKNRAIRKMAKTMPGFLVGSWGKSDHYSIGQVDRAIKDTNCNTDYSDYAYAMFCSEEDFSEVSGGSYHQLSTEIGGMFFYGNSNYSVADFTNSPFEKNIGGGSSDSFGDVGGGFDGD